MRHLLAGIAAAAVLAFPALASAPAATALRFSGYGSAAGELDEPFGIAVARTTGDLYVLDSNNFRIERFSKDGAFEMAWGWGVADGRTRAAQTCRRTCFRGLRGSAPGQLDFAEDVAIDNDPRSPGYGDVYVADIGNSRIERFSSSGRFLAVYGRGVNVTARRAGDRAHEDVCPLKPGDRCGAGRRGSGPGEFEFPVEGHLLAVGSDGRLYVGDRNRVERFSARGRYQGEITLLPKLNAAHGEAGGVSGLAVDARGDLYVIRNGVSGVREYAPDGEPLRVYDDKGEPAYPEGPTPVVALDGNGHVLVDEFVRNSHRIREYDAGGHELAVFDAGNEDVLHGLAYNPANRLLYALDTNGNVSPPRAFVRTLTLPAPSLLRIDFGFVAELLSW